MKNVKDGQKILVVVDMVIVIFMAYDHVLRMHQIIAVGGKRKEGAKMATAKLTVPILLEWKDIEAYMAQHNIVKVVRCKDCKHSFKRDFGFGCDLDYRLGTNGKWYCADGERREDVGKSNTTDNR